MDDKDILRSISGLMQAERDLRARLAAGELTSQDEREQLRDTEEQLDQCWDLLRQRRARRDSGGDPAAAAQRPASEVEEYLQ